MVFAPFNMKVNVELNETDLENLFEIYTLLKPHIDKLQKRKDMPETIYELDCEHCGNEWELSYIERDDSDDPLYCPFCGCDVDLSDVEEESLNDDDFDVDELNFEQD
jgi:predicted Zn-ribbon and HTH transcriptional regulator